jgi:integrase/recombinase XerC
VFHEASFLQFLSQERRLSAHTLTAYRNDLTQFVLFCQHIQCLTSVAEVRHLHVRAWAVSLLEAGQVPRSVNRRLSCLKTYFHYLRKRQVIRHDPMQKVVAPKSGKRLPVVVQEQEMAVLFSKVAFPEGYKGQLHRIVLETLYATGLRRSELAQLQLSDLDFSRGVIKVMGKGGKQRLAPMPSFLAKLLSAFIEHRHAEFPATNHTHLLLSLSGKPMPAPSLYPIVRRYLRLVSSAEQHSPHVLRHSFATHLSNHGADLNAIKELLGHANLAATQIYTHNSAERLKKVYEQAHPKGEAPEEDKT